MTKYRTNSRCGDGMANLTMATTVQACYDFALWKVLCFANVPKRFFFLKIDLVHEARTFSESLHDMALQNLLGILPNMMLCDIAAPWMAYRRL